MHIPDAAISPTTSLVTGIAMLPVWFTTSRQLRQTLETRQVPQLAIGAAFCFTVMLFNLPVPGGTTVHPVGGVLLAILLGPRAAILGVTVALAIQALFFGDGGVFALGANCFTMAFALPVCGYAVYRLAAGRSPADSPRHAFAAGIGAYFGLNVAALLVALILGLQPVLFHEPNGHALYFPFGLAVTIPAILLAHLTVVGVAEASVTVLVVRYLQSSRIPLYASGRKSPLQNPPSERLWLGLAALLALSPLGLLAKGEAWGEWSADDIAKRAGYAPQNFAANESHGWHGFNFLPDYLSERGPIFYAGAGLFGVLLIAGLVLLLGRLLAKRSGRKSVETTTSTLKEGDVPGWMVLPNPPAPFPDSFASHHREGGDGSFVRFASRFFSLVSTGLTNASPVFTENSQPSNEPYNLTSPPSLRRRSESGKGAGGLGKDYIEKTLAGLAASIQENVFAEKWARQDGLLQRLDPRVKIVMLLGFVVLTTFLHRLPVLLGLTALTLGLAVASRLTLGMFVRRVWLSVPLFVGGLALPAALSQVTPGVPLLVILPHPYLAVTKPGLVLAGVLALRAGVAISFVTLLALTTRWNELLYGLRVLFVPKAFLTILAMTYRYLAVLVLATQEVFLARKSRAVGSASLAVNRQFLGGAMGGLFGKTLVLTEEVHAAMCARGWTGNPSAVRGLRLQARDVVWLGAMLVLAFLALRGERLPYGL